MNMSHKVAKAGCRFVAECYHAFGAELVSGPVEWPPQHSLDPDEATCEICGSMDCWVSPKTIFGDGQVIYCVHCDPPVAFQEFLKPKPGKWKVWRNV